MNSGCKSPNQVPLPLVVMTCRPVSIQLRDGQHKGIGSSRARTSRQDLASSSMVGVEGDGCHNNPVRVACRRTSGRARSISGSVTGSKFSHRRAESGSESNCGLEKIAARCGIVVSFLAYGSPDFAC